MVASSHHFGATWYHFGHRGVRSLASLPQAQLISASILRGRRFCAKGAPHVLEDVVVSFPYPCLQFLCRLCPSKLIVGWRIQLGIVWFHCRKMRIVPNESEDGIQDDLIDHEHGECKDHLSCSQSTRDTGMTSNQRAPLLHPFPWNLVKFTPNAKPGLVNFCLIHRYYYPPKVTVSY